MSGVVFQWQWPWALLLLVGLLPLYRMFRDARRARGEMVLQFGGQVDAARPLKDGMRLVGITMLLLALARPGIDPQRLSVANVGRDVVFVLDVSQSMLAEDAAPSRLEVSKQGVRDALDSFQSARAGLVIYAGSANILCPLTHDYDFVRYMLEQATPRSVNFGGTQLISAVEKSVDQVFSKGRAGFQDMVLLTDGEDHAQDFDEIAELLKEVDAGLLIVGVGGAEHGARIPQMLEGGKLDWLRYEGQPVETKLNRKSLQELAKTYPDSQYQEVGTTPFNLGALYLEFAQERPSGGSDNVGDTIVVYREVGVLLMFIGLALFLMAEFNIQAPWRKLRRLVLIITCLMVAEIGIGIGITGDARAEFDSSFSFSENFNGALKLHHENKYEDALAIYQQIGANNPDATSEELAVVQFNTGLCLLHLSAQQAELSAHTALAEARRAQRAFLLAKQLAPDFERAGQRLDTVGALILNYHKNIEAEERQAKEIQERVQAMLEKLQALATVQEVLQQEIPQRIRRNRNKNKNTPPVQEEAPTTPPSTAQWPPRQQAMMVTGKEVEAELAELDGEMTIQVQGMPATASAFKQPLTLMGQAVGAQELGATFLLQQADWPLARRELTTAVRLMNEILQMLADQNSSDSQEGDEDWEMEEEDWEMYDEGEYEESQSSSMPMSGDMAQSSQMQPLPKPNYSAEEILGEETENQQFRQQKRAASQVGKVEKDW